MARDPRSLAVEQAAPEWFQARAAELGTTPAQLSDAEHRQLAAEFVFDNMGGLYAQARRLEGDLVDVSVSPEWAARLQAVGASPQALADFAAAWDSDLPRRDAVRKLERQAARASGTTTAPEPPARLYDRPY